MTNSAKDESAVSGGCRTCSACKVAMHESYFGLRSDRPGHRLSTCKACMRERWVRWSRSARGGKARPDRRGTVLRGDVQTMAWAIASAAKRLGPDVSGLKVYRMPSGEVRYWRSAMFPPHGSEFIGLYDFDAKAEYIAEDLAA